MDQRELHVQHLGICYKLYHFIMNTLAAQACKTVTLGRSNSHYGSSSIKDPISDAAQRDSGTRAHKMMRPETTPYEGLFGDSIISPSTEHDEEKKNPCRNTVDENVPRAPKKMVSINDNVEEIILPNNNKKKRSKSLEKSNSLGEEENQKPLRSILKVGSNFSDKSNSAS
ncbi:hypothetical protein SESBI_16780 [Sesbania bispinosa]|nr:hypothetical protein SESBI_16780 [Sesbania bispinosa]